jgi:diketogulonate reductase-like aldo/keto reductase
MSCPVGAAAGLIKLKRCSNEKQHEKTTPEPLRAKWLARSKTIIIITEASDERIQELLRLFDDGHRLPGS